jgi:pseudaminic acid synthase
VTKAKGQVKYVNFFNTALEPGAMPIVVAEISGNHDNKVENIEKLMHKIKESGVDFVKLQTYTPERITLDSKKSSFVVKSGLWAGKSLFELYSKGETPNSWLPRLFSLAKDLEITLFSSPFSPEDVSILEKFDCPIYKVASLEITYTQLLKSIAETGKPVIMSTGGATLEEVQFAIDTLCVHGTTSLVLLKCSPTYPAKLEDLNLNTIPFLREKFNIPIGFSDHTEGSIAALIATALGSTVIEKHVKLDEDVNSVDAQFALKVSMLPNFVEQVRDACRSMGHVKVSPTDSELETLKYRRSIIAKEDMNSGDVIEIDKVAIVRPYIGMNPKDLDFIVGKKLKSDIERGEGLTRDLIE